MSSKDSPEHCAGLTVHTSCQDGRPLVTPPPMTDSVSPDGDVAQKTQEPLPPPEKTPQPGFTNPSLPLDSQAESVFVLDEWVLDLNRSLQEHHGNNPASISLLTKAGQVCDEHVERLTKEYREQSENPLKKLLKKASTKKQRKKTIRMFDPDLRTVNEKVEELMLVKRQLESRLKQLLTGPQQQEQEQKHPQQEKEQFVPIPTPAELKVKATLPWKCGFCGDLMLCVLLSCFVMFLLLMLSTRT